MYSGGDNYMRGAFVYSHYEMEMETQNKPLPILPRCRVNTRGHIFRRHKIKKLKLNHGLLLCGPVYLLIGEISTMPIRDTSTLWTSQRVLGRGSQGRGWVGVCTCAGEGGGGN